MITHRSIARDILILFFASVVILMAAYFGLSRYIGAMNSFTDPVEYLLYDEYYRNPLLTDQFDRIDRKVTCYG